MQELVGAVNTLWNGVGKGQNAVDHVARSKASPWGQGPHPTHEQSHPAARVGNAILNRRSRGTNRVASFVASNWLL